MSLRMKGKLQAGKLEKREDRTVRAGKESTLKEDTE